MRSNVWFVVWGLLVLVLIGLLTTLGFMLKKHNSNYIDLEYKLVASAEDYVSNISFTNREVLKITKEELLENNFIDNLEYKNDVCDGYVLVNFQEKITYKAYILCNNYKTRDYEKN